MLEGVKQVMGYKMQTRSKILEHAGSVWTTGRGSYFKGLLVTSFQPIFVMQDYELILIS